MQEPAAETPYAAKACWVLCALASSAETHHVPLRDWRDSFCALPPPPLQPPPPARSAPTKASGLRDDVGDALVGRCVKKAFPRHGTFKGRVKHFDSSSRFYEIKYADGDSENVKLKDLRKILVGEALAEETLAEETLVPQDGVGAALIGRRVKKRFSGLGDFEGTVKKYDKGSCVYAIKYDDGDDENVKLKGLEKILVKVGETLEEGEEEDLAKSFLKRFALPNESGGRLIQHV